MENNLENMEKIEIREATPEDVLGISTVLYKTWLATYPNEEYGVTIEDIEYRYKDAFTDEKIKARQERMRSEAENLRSFVVECNGEIVGTIGVIKSPEQNELTRIYVLPEFQGKGIGKKLWEKAGEFLDFSKDTIVKVVTYNTGAIGFYERLGFVDTGKRFADENFKMQSGAKLPEMEMILKAKSI